MAIPTLVLVPPAAAAEDTGRLNPKPITIGTVVQMSEPVGLANLVQAPIKIHDPGASFLKLHFAELALPAGAYITVSGLAGGPSHRYPGSSFTRDTGPGFWALSILGDTVIVELHQAHLLEGAAGQKAGFLIDKYTRGLEDAFVREQNALIGPTSICGGNDQEDVVCRQGDRPTEYARSRAVARLVLNNGSSLCTGWRVGPNDDTMFTNEHCITSQAGVAAAEAWFDYDNQNCGGGGVGNVVMVSGNQLLIDNVTLDFALFTINNPGAVSSFGFLELDPRGAAQNEEIYIPQHPGGQPKKFGVDSDLNTSGLCRVDDPLVNGRGTNSDMGYSCDTAGGSSGSPVLARSSHRVIALHHFGGCLNSGARMQLIFPLVEPFLDDAPPPPPPPPPPPDGCLHQADFGDAGGWTQGNSTCATGRFVVGSPTQVVNGGVTTQPAGGADGSTNAFFTAPNSAAGTDDVDGGTCEALSPVINASGEAAIDVSLAYFHGQRDAGGDDGFSIEVLNNGVVVRNLVAIGAVTNNAAWTPVSTTISNPGNVQIRVRATDGPASGDLIEGGIDSVRVCPSSGPPPPPPGGCVVNDSFENGAAGWSNNAASTCTTGAYILGTPTQAADGGVTTQVGGAHTGANAIFTAANTSAGVNDVDGGNCILSSPTWSVPQTSTLEVWAFHGQRDGGGDPAGDFMRVEVSTNGGQTFQAIGTAGDATSNAAWQPLTATIPAGSQVQLRVQCSDGTASGDLVECGIDDLRICQ